MSRNCQKLVTDSREMGQTCSPYTRVQAILGGAGMARCDRAKKYQQREVPRMEIKKVGVLGCGLMGSGIAQACATGGFEVISLEVDQKFIDKGFAGIRKSLEKFSSKGSLKEPVQQILARL